MSRRGVEVVPHGVFTEQYLSSGVFTRAEDKTQSPLGGSEFCGPVALTCVDPYVLLRPTLPRGSNRGNR